jgi:tRNA/rRNA methyltransferase
MKTMGLSELALVSPRHFPHADADARAAGALDVLQRARIYDKLTDALGDRVLTIATSSRQRELVHQTIDARAAAFRLIEAAAQHPVALVFGNETSGLSGDEARLCQLWAAIPANPAYASLNLAAAVQVFAYEIGVAAGAGVPVARAPPAAVATHDQVEQLHAHLERTMVHVGYLDPAQPKRLAKRLRRLLARARCEVEEVNILRGFLNAVEKLRRS